MARDFVIFGECMVQVWGAGALSTVAKNLPSSLSTSGSAVLNLGLTSDETRVSFTNYHKEIKTDGYGETVPAELSYQLASCNIEMNLIHFDVVVLDAVQTESEAGTGISSPSIGQQAGTLVAAGAMMGNGATVGFSGCHYMSLVLLSPLDTQGNNFGTYRFPATYLVDRGAEIPLSPKASEVRLTWKAVPYLQQPKMTQVTGPLGPSFSTSTATPTFPFMSGGPDISSSGVILWDHFALI